MIEAARLATLRSIFSETYLASAEFGAHAPGRANLIGDHTDYNHGLVLPFAIDLRCVALCRVRRGSHRCRVRSLQSTLPDRIESIGLDDDPSTLKARGWLSYVAGVLRLLRDNATRAQRQYCDGLDLLIDSDLPLGAGLSSSASLEVSVALVAMKAWALHLPELDTARLCQRAEHEYAGVPCGLMDQAASLCSRARHFTLMDCRSESITHVPAPSAMHLLIVDTRLKHALADGEYQHRRATCEAVAAKLGVPSLRDAHLSDVSRDVLSDRERACLRHVVTENTRVASAAEAIERGTATSIGPLLFASHASLRDDFQVSTEHLDFIVDAAKAATSAGIWGARMTGAGFGGSVIVAGDRPGIESFGSDIAQRFESRFHKDCTVCEVAPAAPAGLSPF